jgi:hypothetical protein
VSVVNEQVPPITDWRDGFRRTPLVWRVAALIGVLGWFLTLGGSTTRVANGVSDCDGFDLGPLVVAAAVAVLALVGWRRTRQGHPAMRLPRRWAWIGIGVLGALALVHVLRTVVDPAGGMC